MPHARTKAVTVALATAACLAAAIALGPLDPPDGPVSSTGVTLGQLNAAIAGLGTGGAEETRRSPIEELEAQLRSGFIEVDGVDGPVVAPFPDRSTRIYGYVDLALGSENGRFRVVEEVRVGVVLGEASNALRGNLAGARPPISSVKISVFKLSGSGQFVVASELELIDARVVEAQNNAVLAVDEFTLVADEYIWTTYVENAMGMTQPLTPVTYVR